MNQTILAVFAHPDDESFGPAGTLSLLTRSAKVMAVYITDGEACSVPESFAGQDMATIRGKELERAAAHIGLAEVVRLGFPDEQLTNRIIPRIVESLESLIARVRPSSVLTFEPHGFSGHLDHIATTSAVTTAARRSRDISSRHYFAINRSQRRLLDEYYVHFPAGYDQRRLNTVIDVSNVWDRKLKAIDAHVSQEGDRRFWAPMVHGYAKREHWLSEYRDHDARTQFLDLIGEEHILKAGNSITVW